MKRWGWFLASVAASVALTALLWLTIGPAVAAVLALPLLFWPRGGRGRRCPACGFTSNQADVRYCPHDGSRLPAHDV